MVASNYVGRFAPSPTGPLHFGSLVAALASYLDARHADGRWLLRIEDIDEPRCQAKWADVQMAALTACGFTWDGEVVWQSQRGPAYQAALNRLRAAGHTYACTCTRKELADSLPQPLPSGGEQVYPGTCRRAQRSEHGAAIRVIAPAERIEVNDRLQGRLACDLDVECGDFIVRRKDGLFAYQLAVVVDDAMQGVTDVVRGADLLDSTPRQVWLQRLLGLPTPRYLHLPVAVDAGGHKLSKQTLAPALDTEDALAWLARALAFLGQDVPVAGNPRELLAQAIERWRPARIPAKTAQPVPSEFPRS